MATEVRTPALLAFNVDDYYRMSAAGVFQGKRVELIEGEIFQMPPIGPLHAAIVDQIAMLLIRALADNEALVRVQGPVRLGDESEPQPDLAILRPRPGGYREFHPAPKDVIWLVEVSDSTLSFDRNTKLGMYARANISEVWIINLADGVIELSSVPVDGSFMRHEVVSQGVHFSPHAFPDLQIAIDDILGPPPSPSAAALQ